MTRGDPGSRGENSGVDKEWRGEEEVLVCSSVGFSKQHDGYRCQIHTT